MTRIYRILRKAFARHPFDGEGAYLFGGRWSSVGTRLSYASEHQSLAMLEYFVHLDKEDPPDDLVLAVAEVPLNLKFFGLGAANLPSNWRDAMAPAELTRFGDDFARAGKRCILKVPSVLAPSENNWLLNPAHEDFQRIAVRGLEPLHYDPRMFRKQLRRPH